MLQAQAAQQLGCAMRPPSISSVCLWLQGVVVVVVVVVIVLDFWFCEFPQGAQMEKGFNLISHE